MVLVEYVSEVFPADKVKLPEVMVSLPFDNVKLPEVNVTFFPEATVVSPFNETVPVPVEKVPVEED